MTPPLDRLSPVFRRAVVEMDIWDARHEPLEMKARIMEAYTARVIDEWDVEMWIALYDLGDV